MRVFVIALVVGMLCSNGAFARDRLNLHLAFGTRTPLYGSLGERLVSAVAARSSGRLQLRTHEPDAIVPQFGYLDAVAQGALDAAWDTPAVLIGRVSEAGVPAADLAFGLH